MGDIDTQELERNLEELKTIPVPVKRAAFSDRTAWILAILAELVYLEFDEENDAYFLDLARELANLTDEKKVKEKLEAVQATLARLHSPAADDKDKNKNKKLKAVLAAGGFKLAGDKVIFDKATDTQCIVVVRPDNEDTGLGMAVVCFRGTESFRDWLTNANAGLASLKNARGEVQGRIHKGFLEGYESVKEDIENRLKDHHDLPLYITGHSLGGALAVVATWFQNSDRLAACYTFGAPRVGDNELIDKFKTPIYRIVNGPDPVTLLPPAQWFVVGLKMTVRSLRVILPFAGVLDWCTRRLVEVQGYRHYGNMRYLTMVKNEEDNSYPGLKLEYGLSSMLRAYRFYESIVNGEGERIDKYHQMRRYRAKLRAYAHRRNESRFS